MSQQREQREQSEQRRKGASEWAHAREGEAPLTCEKLFSSKCKGM